jgi:hypothetical protein
MVISFCSRSTRDLNISSLLGDSVNIGTVIPININKIAKTIQKLLMQQLPSYILNKIAAPHNTSVNDTMIVNDVALNIIPL